MGISHPEGNRHGLRSSRIGDDSSNATQTQSTFFNPCKSFGSSHCITLLRDREKQIWKDFLLVSWKIGGKGGYNKKKKKKKKKNHNNNKKKNGGF